MRDIELFLGTEGIAFTYQYYRITDTVIVKGPHSSELIRQLHALDLFSTTSRTQDLINIVAQDDGSALILCEKKALGGGYRIRRFSMSNL